MPRLLQNEREQAVGIVRAGMTHADVANHFHVTRITISGLMIRLGKLAQQMIDHVTADPMRRRNAKTARLFCLIEKISQTSVCQHQSLIIQLYRVTKSDPRIRNKRAQKIIEIRYEKGFHLILENLKLMTDIINTVCDPLIETSVIVLEPSDKYQVEPTVKA
ncbi:unnamed protein product [Mytilus coruscus]|uniref:Uncharacterized protein n=1 Tax=Mytilus coruscus TaxID=42192 RepID=A0A6J8CJC6_MYTCO|nr:unnamed protein product [Mytilus coruscus]